jgi:hypothetical protein
MAKTNNAENVFTLPSRPASLEGQRFVPGERPTGSEHKRGRLKHRRRHLRPKELRTGGVWRESEVIEDQPFPAPNRSASKEPRRLVESRVDVHHANLEDKRLSTPTFRLISLVAGA